MARTTVAALWAGVAVFALGGCGTVHNFYGDDADAPPCRVFGGVRSDVTTGVRLIHFNPAEDHGDYPAQLCADPAVQMYAKTIGWYLLTVDMPLSAVGDTVTLPGALLGQLLSSGTPPETREKPPRRRRVQTPETGETSPGGPSEAESP
jgi:uncharacterized protein YceK